MARSKENNEWIRSALKGKDPEQYNDGDAKQARNLYRSTLTFDDRVLSVKIGYQARFNADVKAIQAEEAVAGTTDEQHNG